MQKLIDPTLQMAALSALEHALNRALKLDPATRARLAALDGQAFHLHCTRPDLQLFLLPRRDRVQLAAFHDGDVTAGLTGEARDFAKLLRSDDPAAELINGKLSVVGDTRALMQLQRIAAELDIDWQAPLARAFGDVAGHALGQGLQHLASRARYAGRQLLRQLQDFAVHESHQFAAQGEVAQFGRDVDQLARRGAQLESQLAALRQRLPRR